MSIQLKQILLNNVADAYIASTGIQKAAELAYALKRPLLLSGEPGTGKTRFAYYLADSLKGKGFNKNPLVFNTKTTSVAQDLFYHYDAIAQFRDNNLAGRAQETATASPSTSQAKTTADYIQLKELGLAMANAIGGNNLTSLETSIQKNSRLSVSPASSVVLIDEIDKAPRDFPNDLLNELERFEFSIKEINFQLPQLTDEQKGRILIVLTSNYEKNLPDAFLRRCVYYHIPFPDDKILRQIIRKRLDMPDNGSDNDFKALIGDFFTIRNHEGLQKKPSTAEAVDLVAALREDDLIGKNNDLRLLNEKKKAPEHIIPYLSVLLKKQEDLQLFIEQ